MNLTVVSVSYPLSEVGPSAVGGSEQVQLAIDGALGREGHRSVVIASQGSAPRGILIPISKPVGPWNEEAKSAAQEEVRRALRFAMARFSVDLVHLHGLDFCNYLPEAGVPVLATLHLHPSWYPPEVFRTGRPFTYLQCVSRATHRVCPPHHALLPPIENGIPTDRFNLRLRKRNFCLALGRICPEKGFHLAIDAARVARVPLLIGGKVFSFREHVSYFQTEIVPRLAQWGRFLGPLGFRRKRRLISAARCLLISSVTEETSSLVAMEALATGTPVVGFRFPALAEIVEQGRAGFLVSSASEMAAAIAECDRIDPEVCRQVARERFSVHRMTREYLDLYRRIVIAARTNEVVHSI